MTSPDLFEWNDGQPRQLRRVHTRLAPLVLTFLRMRGVHGTFHAQELRDFVGPLCAPASADRVLRALRAEGRIDYEILSRSASKYRITRISI